MINPSPSKTAKKMRKPLKRDNVLLEIHWFYIAFSDETGNIKMRSNLKHIKSTNYCSMIFGLFPKKNETTSTQQQQPCPKPLNPPNPSPFSTPKCSHQRVMASNVGGIPSPVRWWMLMGSQVMFGGYQLPFIAPHRRSCYSCKPSAGAVSKSDRFWSLDSNICCVRSHSSIITTFSFQRRVGLRLESVNPYRWLLDWDPVHPLVQRCRFFFCQAQCSHPTCANVSFSKFLRDERGCWLNQHHAHACLAS